MLYKTYGRNIYAAANCIAQLNNTVILSVCNGAGRQIKLSCILVNKDNTGIQLLTSASSVAEGRVYLGAHTQYCRLYLGVNIGGVYINKITEEHMTEFIFNKVRVQLLGNNIVRLEQSKKNAFCDDSTYFIPDRSGFSDVTANTANDADGNNIISFNNLQIFVPESGDGLNGVTVSLDGKTVYKYKRTVNSGELPPLEKTPQIYTVADNPRIIMPDRGYCSGAKYVTQENVGDVYLLICGGDHKLLRKLYVELTGRTEMVRLSTLGFWNSRYFAHNEQTAKDLILEYAEKDVPLDNMVLDTDWRKASDRGIGYDIDEDLFPDMRGFYKFAHKQGVEIMFNDHPEPVEGAKSLLDRKEIKYRERKLKEHLRMGLDYWWYDRNWHTKLISPSKNVNPESLGSYLFADVTRQHFAGKGSGEVYRRPVIMSNADNIANGNYVGIQDSASHRYSVQWTGDIASDDSSIATEIKNMLLAQNSCITYVNSDCGGHTGNPTKQEFIRWMQFGAFSPVFRPHCTKGVVRFREPWAYDEETLKIVRQFVQMRYRLLPVIYKSAYESYVYGQPLFQPLSYRYIEDVKTHKIEDEYLLGDNILIAPLHGTAPKKVGLECYCGEVRASYFDDTKHQGEPLYNTTYRKLDLYWNHTSPHESVPVYNFSAVFETRLRFNKDVELIVEADDGVTVEIDGKETLRDDTFHSACKMKAGVLSACEIHNVKIYYFQGGGEASISLFYNEIPSKYNLVSRDVYLPEGIWIDVFGGVECKGGKRYSRKYALCEMPLFVRKGAAVPLLECRQNTKLLDWSRLTLDLFPDREAEITDYVYEDDKQTTAYKQGVIRTSRFTTRFNGGKNAFCLTLEPSVGSYGDGITARRVTVKYHLIKGMDKVRKVLVNGNSVKFEIAEQGATYPFSAERFACDGKTLIVDFDHPLDGTTEVEFVLK